MQLNPWRGTGTSGRGGVGGGSLLSLPKAEEESVEEDLNQSHSLRAVVTGAALSRSIPNPQGRSTESSLLFADDQPGFLTEGFPLFY